MWILNVHYDTALCYLELVSRKGDCRGRRENHYFPMWTQKDHLILSEEIKPCTSTNFLPRMLLPSSWGSTFNTLGCCSLTAGDAFIAGMTQVCKAVWIQAFADELFGKAFSSLQAAVKG